MSTEVSFASLIGEHTLDVVDGAIEKFQEYEWRGAEDCQTLTFRLDGVTYTAIEDPDDGYRSAMRRLIERSAVMKNVFAPQRVLARMKDAGKYGTCNILQILDMVTGKVVIQVGTDNTDDYYPCFVAMFDPRAMACNQGSAA